MKSILPVWQPCLFAVALVLVALAAGCQRPSKGEQLFQEFYQPYEIETDPTAPAISPLLTEAEAAYQREDYETVAELTGRFTRENYRLPKVMMGQAIAWIELGHPDSALQNLEIVNAHPLYRDHTRWYRALVHVRVGDFVAADAVLEEILNDPNTQYAERATRLREAIAS